MCCAKKPGVAVDQSFDQPNARRHRRPHMAAGSSARPSAKPMSFEAMIAQEGDHRRRRQRRRDRPPHCSRPRQPGRHGVRPATDGRDRQIDQPTGRRSAAIRNRQDQVRMPPRGCRPGRRGRKDEFAGTGKSIRRTAFASTGTSAWVHARPSNTEPIMRIIAEAPDKTIADRRIADSADRAAAFCERLPRTRMHGKPESAAMPSDAHRKMIRFRKHV